MATQFFDLLNKYYRLSPEFNKQVEKARDWFRATAMQIKIVAPEKVVTAFTTNASRQRLVPRSTMDNSVIGRLIVFRYDPKWKEKLPYYDIFPLVLPMRIIPGKQGQGAGFIGLNLHYLPYDFRAKLLDAIYSYYKDRHLDEKVKLRLTYNMLKGSSRYKWFKPCVKRYLFTHVRSRFNQVDPKEWDMVAFLPMAMWRKATEQRVWADSRRMIR